MKNIKNEIKRRLRTFRKWHEEKFDYYSVHTYFILSILKNQDVKGIASIGCRLDQLVPLKSLYSKIYHFTMLPVKGLNQFNEIFKENLVEVCGDFFALKDGGYPQIDTVLSQATIHCMTDTRYGNKGRENGIPRPYQFARKCKKVFPNVKNVIVSVTVNKNDNIAPNGAWLMEDKFIETFVKEGFLLQDKYYDKFDIPQDGSKRFTREFPDEYAKKVDYFMGNYYFKC